jgi:ATP-dependent Zn protease
LTVLPCDDRREPLLPQRTFPAHHHRAARLPGEPDASCLAGRTSRSSRTRSSSRRSKAGGVNDVEFNPNRQEIKANLVEGQKVKVNYPTAQSATQFQNLLTANNVKFDSKGTGSSAWWALLINVLPFVILIAFWIFLMNQVRAAGRR